MRKITYIPRLAKKRNKLILQLSAEGFYLDEIGEIFRLSVGRVSQILKKVGKEKSNINLG